MSKSTPHIDMENLKGKTLSRREIFSQMLVRFDSVAKCIDRSVRIGGSKMWELARDMVFLGENPTPNEIKRISKRWLAFAQEEAKK